MLTDTGDGYILVMTQNRDQHFINKDVSMIIRYVTSEITPANTYSI